MSGPRGKIVGGIFQIIGCGAVLMIAPGMGFFFAADLDASPLVCGAAGVGMFGFLVFCVIEGGVNIMRGVNQLDGPQPAPPPKPQRGWEYWPPDEKQRQEPRF